MKHYSACFSTVEGKTSKCTVLNRGLQDGTWRFGSQLHHCGDFTWTLAHFNCSNRVTSFRSLHTRHVHVKMFFLFYVNMATRHGFLSSLPSWLMYTDDAFWGLLEAPVGLGCASTLLLSENRLVGRVSVLVTLQKLYKQWDWLQGRPVFMPSPFTSS